MLDILLTAGVSFLTGCNPPILITSAHNCLSIQLLRINTAGEAMKCMDAPTHGRTDIHEVLNIWLDPLHINPA